MPSLRVGTLSLVVVLAACPAAFARSVQYNGPAGPGVHAGIEFGTTQARGKRRIVRRFEFHNIPAQCTGSGATAVNDLLTITMKVARDRSFSGSQTLNGGREKVKVTGRFAVGFGKASGTLHVSGTVAGCSSADTGTVKWKAPVV